MKNIYIPNAGNGQPVILSIIKGLVFKCNDFKDMEEMANWILDNDLKKLGAIYVEHHKKYPVLLFNYSSDNTTEDIAKASKEAMRVATTKWLEKKKNSQLFTKKEFSNWRYADNILFQKDRIDLIKLDYPRAIVTLRDRFFASDFDVFQQNSVVQFLDADAIDEELREDIVIEAYNFSVNLEIEAENLR